MVKSIKNITTILMLSIVIYANNAVAKDCYEPSPNLTDHGKKYFDLEETKILSNREKNQLNGFFRKIVGRWAGLTTNIECRGPESAPRETYKKATIKAKTTLASNGNLTITAKKKYIKERINRSEKLTLLGASRIFEFEFINDNHLTFSEKYRKANVNTSASITKNRTTRFIESIVEISLKNHTLVLTRNYYINGVYIGEEQWSMVSH